MSKTIVYRTDYLVATIYCGPERSDGGDRRMVELNVGGVLHTMSYKVFMGFIGKVVFEELGRELGI